ncbi:Gfo/Idh/MocA family oxidoreductase, partial [Streptomyces anulatus]
MRIGLIGTGRIGTFHAEVLSRHPAVDALLLADAAPERAAGAAARTGATAVPVDGLFGGEGAAGGPPDAVVICSATSAHAGLIAR